MNEIITVSPRSVDTITHEIISIANNAAQILLLSVCQMGKRMLEAKELCAHGEWGSYLDNLCGQLGVSTSTAHNWIKLYNAYGEASNLQSLGNLTYTKAVQLLRLPGESRQEFVESHDVDAMSSRELERAIQAQRKAEAEAQKLRKTLAEQRVLNKEMEQTIYKSAAAEADAKAALQQLQENPEIPAAKIEAIAEEARKQAEAAYAEQLRKTQEEAEDKEQARSGMEAALVEAQRQIQELKKASAHESQVLSDPDGAAFEVYLKELAEIINKMSGHYIKTKGRNPDLASRMVNAFRGVTTKLDDLTRKMEAENGGADRISNRGGNCMGLSEVV